MPKMDDLQALTGYLLIKITFFLLKKKFVQKT